MRSSDRILVMGCLVFMSTLLIMVYFSRMPPIQNSLIHLEISSSDSTSKVEDTSTDQKEEILEQLRHEVHDVTGGDDTLGTYRYVLRLLRALKDNHILKSDSSNSESIMDMKPAEITPTPKYWRKSPQRLYIRMHHMTLQTFDLILPFAMLKMSRESDISQLVAAMVKYKMTYKKPMRPKEFMLNMYGHGVTTTWQRFHNNISNYGLYHAGDKLVETLLDDLSNMDIIWGTQKSRGTQVKMNFTLEDKGMALFKPMRFPRSQGTLPNHFYFNDYERHTAEIAAFHLDRLLGFFRTPPVAGRVVNITQDIFRFADKHFANTFFISRANNMCFYGECKQFCDIPHAVCGHPVLLEGSMAVMIQFERKRYRHPWRRSYSTHSQVLWERYNICKIVKQDKRFKKGRTLLDLMDMALFDFLMGNDDRHHYEIIDNFGNQSYPLYYDHGRAWGKPHIDDLSAMAPIYQCCMLRYTTLETLLRFNKGPITLGKALKLSLAHDPLPSVLLDDHFEAVDRRVKIALQIVSKCVHRSNHITEVVINDGL